MTALELKFIGEKEERDLLCMTESLKRKGIFNGQDSVEHMLILDNWNFE